MKHSEEFTVAETVQARQGTPLLKRVALIGNPNTGKSTVFNALAGMNARTGNYPGVTIEKKLGRYSFNGQGIELIDLPGTYSLAPRSPDEWVTVDVLTGDTSVYEPIDAIVCVVNATQLQRNLFLVSQIMELGKPVVLAINMADVAKSRGYQIDSQKLSQRLGIPVVMTTASRRDGIEPLRQAIDVATSQVGAQSSPARPLPATFYAIRDELRQQLSTAMSHSQSAKQLPDDYVLERALIDENSQAVQHIEKISGKGLAETITKARQRLRSEVGIPVEVECNARYAWVEQQLAGAVQTVGVAKANWTDRIDAIVTHRLFGLVLFVLMMLAVFQAIYSFAQIPMGVFEAAQEWTVAQVEGVIGPGILRSLIVDGAIAGVGGVLIFVPQIALLFLFIALLEDCGYMARAAFLMDRAMSWFGLSGKSFLPLMSSFACAVPGIMATRVIENYRDRIATIIVAPFMSCSARLPVYMLLVFAFVPGTAYWGGWLTLPGLVLMAMYFVGVLVAVPTAWLLKRTVLRGEPAPFVMELPEYKWPSIPVVVARVYQACKAFVVRAGTLIFSASVLIWAAGYFPGDHSERYALQGQIEQLQGLDELSDVQQAELEQLQANYRLISGDLLAGSLLGRTGKLIEPVVKPLGWDWKIGVGAIASFPAREVIIATLGTIYSLGGDVDEEDEGLIAALRAARWPDGTPIYNFPVALSIMVFFALCAQCVSTLLVIRRETNSWRWPIFSFTYMTGLAYFGAMLVYQVGIRIGG